MPKNINHKITTSLKQKIKSNNINLISIISTILIFVLAAVPFGYGKYLEFCTDGPFDGSMYVYAAKCILKGQIVDKDIVPGARPATLLVNIIGVAIFGYSELGPKIIQTMMQISALLLLFYTLKKIYGILPAAVAIFIAAFFLSCPPFAKYGNVKEQFMISCMIIAACSLILHHHGSSWKWLLLSGAVAINIYFFKPTGASVMIAMGIYILFQPILKHRSWQQLGMDLAGLFLGAFIGIMPLIILYSWQGQLLLFLRITPFLGNIIAFFSESQSSGIQSIIKGGQYIQASRDVSTFSAQYDTVMKYYHSFIIPIGFAVVAIIWHIQLNIKKITSHYFADSKPLPINEHQKNIPSQPDGGYYVLLLAIWWVLDMLFVWISPRSYVEYYLPLNASAAMLAAYVIYCCRINITGFFMLIVAWLCVDFFITGVIISDTAPRVSLRSSLPEHYGAQFALHLIPIAPALAILCFIKKTKLNKIKNLLLLMISLITMAWWLTPNIKVFDKHVLDLRQMQKQQIIPMWEQVGNYIRDNSQPDEDLYVWGWYPGIYVKAQRFSPLPIVAFGDMHTTSPEELNQIINNWVQQLKNNPPKFIVDPQKMHFPFNTHPVFDLWPRMPNQTKQMQFIPTNPEWIEAFPKKMNQYVENYTYKMLTHPDRPGGPLSDEKAKILAETERRRHEAMLPLREFVMNNYHPVVSPQSSMFVFLHNKYSQNK